MKLKKIAFYFGYAVTLLLYILITFYITDYLHKSVNKPLGISILFFDLITLIIYAVLGTLLNLPEIIVNLKKRGKWNVDIYKIMFICCPLIILPFLSYFYWITGVNVQYSFIEILNSSSIDGICKILFGYYFSKSFIKV